jgi:hypothetical protein
MEQILKMEQILNWNKFSNYNKFRKWNKSQKENNFRIGTNFETGTNYKLEQISNLINFELNKINIEQKFESGFFTLNKFHNFKKSKT